MKTYYSSSRGPTDDRSCCSCRADRGVCQLFYNTGFPTFLSFHHRPCLSVGCAPLCDRDLAPDALARPPVLNDALQVHEPRALVVPTTQRHLAGVAYAPTQPRWRDDPRHRRHAGQKMGSRILRAGRFSRSHRQKSRCQSAASLGPLLGGVGPVVAKGGGGVVLFPTGRPPVRAPEKLPHGLCVSNQDRVGGGVDPADALAKSFGISLRLHSELNVIEFQPQKFAV